MMIGPTDDDATQGRPEIAYPCEWEYTVIGLHADAMRKAIAAAAAGLEHAVEPSKTSRTGKYCSLRLEVTVGDQTERDRVFRALVDHEDVTMVI